MLNEVGYVFLPSQEVILECAPLQLRRAAATAADLQGLTPLHLARGEQVLLMRRCSDTVVTDTAITEIVITDT